MFLGWKPVVGAEPGSEEVSGYLMSQIRAGIGQRAKPLTSDPYRSIPSTAVRKAYVFNKSYPRVRGPVPPTAAYSLGTLAKPVRFSVSVVECKIFPCEGR